MPVAISQHYLLPHDYFTSILFIFSVHLLNTQMGLEYIFQREAFQGDKGLLSIEGDAA